MQFLASATEDSGPLIEVKGIDEIRPALEDDSVTLPLTERRCGEGFTKCCVVTGNLLRFLSPRPSGNLGDAVDVFKDGCWWTGRVCKCYDDHITVMFPSEYTFCFRDGVTCLQHRTSMFRPFDFADAEVEEEPYPVWQPPREPENYRVRYLKDVSNLHDISLLRLSGDVATMLSSSGSLVDLQDSKRVQQAKFVLVNYSKSLVFPLSKPQGCIRVVYKHAASSRQT